MTDGLCYVYQSSNTIYAYPDLSCTDGELLPDYNATTRETYYITGGRLVKSSSSTHNNNYGSNNYVAHIYHGESFLDYNSLILPCTAFVICFMLIIYRWFFRLRG